MDGTRANTVSRNSTSTGKYQLATTCAEARGATLTVISQNHQVNVEALAMVSYRLECVHLWMFYTARLAQAREFQVQSPAYERLKDLVKDAANEPKIEDCILGAVCDALLKYRID
jgi:hypothetical protein